MDIDTNKNMMHALPTKAYTSQEWFDLEMKTIFSTTWQFAGFVEDVANPGDYISVQAGLNNIFIIKGRDNRLRAFHNMCRHRGTQLLRAVGKTQKAITCPYHDWTYDLEGKLISIPKKEQEFPDLCNKELHDCGLNLHEASVDIFKGMLFVHPEKKAPNIMSFFGEVEPYLGPHIVEQLVEFSENDEPAFYKEVNANWKIIVENYIDHYHLAHLHEGTLNMYDHSKAEFGWVGPHYWFYEPLVSEYMEDLKNAAPYPLIDSVPKDKIGAYVPWLFPNIGITESESTWTTFHVIPIAPDKTIIINRVKTMNVSEWEYTKQYGKSAMSKVWSKYGNKGKYEGDPETDPMASGDFMAEDVYACEQQQKSLSSPMFSIGARAKKGEYAVMRFQEEVKKWMKAHGAFDKTKFDNE